jgi:pimeloyl-ACP methyl ester carboxylesterase
MEAFFLPRCEAYLRYLDLPGAGPVRVYLHCLGGAGALYLRAAVHPALAGRRAVLVDLLGFGLSDRPEDFGYAPADHADATADLLDRLALGGCDVIGHSMGGHIAVALAIRRPNLVGRLVLAEAPLAFGPDSASRAIATQAEGVFRQRGHRAIVEDLRAEARGDATTAAFLGAFAAAAPHALHRSAAGLLRDGPVLRDRFLSLTLPRAYLWGARTLADPAQAVWSAAFTAHGIATAVVPEAGHHLNLDNPDGFALALAEAFASMPG